MGQFLTPSAAAGVELCRRIRFDAALASYITGVLSELIHSYKWEQNQPTDLTPDQAAALAVSAFEDYLESEDSCMIGAIVAYATTSPPSGVLACDGSNHTRVDYPRLYAALDAAYIVDADNFTVPDLRGRAVIGTGQGAGLTLRALNDSGGEEQHQLTIAEMPDHSHQWTDPGVNVVQEGAPDLALSDPGNPFSEVGHTGGDQPHNNMQPYRALHYGIIAR